MQYNSIAIFNNQKKQMKIIKATLFFLLATFMFLGELSMILFILLFFFCVLFKIFY